MPLFQRGSCTPVVPPAGRINVCSSICYMNQEPLKNSEAVDSPRDFELNYGSGSAMLVGPTRD